MAYAPQVYKRKLHHWSIKGRSWTILTVQLKGSTHFANRWWRLEGFMQQSTPATMSPNSLYSCVMSTKGQQGSIRHQILPFPLIHLCSFVPKGHLHPWNRPFWDHFLWPGQILFSRRTSCKTVRQSRPPYAAIVFESRPGLNFSPTLYLSITQALTADIHRRPV